MPTPRNYVHLVAFAIEHPWAITDAMRALIADILAQRIAGLDPDDVAIADALDARSTRDVPAAAGGSIAWIPIHGVIAPRMNMFTKSSGGTTFDALTEQLQAAVSDPNVKSIHFDVDSPGGNVAGASEFAREVLRARTVKPVVAHANHLMASAAYWAMSGATEIVASPSALVGSIGVYTIHDDISAQLEARGIKREVVSAGKYKAEGADGGPLSDDAKAHIKGLVDGSYGRFVGDVAKGRGIRPGDVRDGYGQGRTLSAEQALTAGMIDRISTSQETLARVIQPTTPALTPLAGTRAAVDAPPVSTDSRSKDSHVARDPALIEYERRALVLQLELLK
jgi:signal peptide peptidase SppA